MLYFLKAFHITVNIRIVNTSEECQYTSCTCQKQYTKYKNYFSTNYAL